MNGKSSSSGSIVVVVFVIIIIFGTILIPSGEIIFCLTHL